MSLPQSRKSRLRAAKGFDIPPPRHIRTRCLEDVRREVKRRDVIEAVLLLALLALVMAWALVQPQDATAETITSKAVYDAPDRVQEATYCALIREHLREVKGASAGEITSFCKQYL